MTPSEHKEKLKPEKESVIFLVFDSTKGVVFIEERLDPKDAYYGYTIIPGGKVENSEVPTDTLIREVKEEMGIEVSRFIYLDSFVEMSLSGNLRKHHAYLITLTHFEGEIFNKEESQGKSRLFSVPLDKTKDYLELASSRYIIDLARKQLEE